VRECTAALECGFDARRDAPVAAGTRRGLLVDETRQAERLLDLRVAPAMGELQARRRQRQVHGVSEGLVKRLGGVARVEVEVRSAPRRRRMQHP
jgi:hypothetical protein